ncbi:fimbria/pilus outer membrane usher protein [Enterobacter mori]|uniref:fimbria/pilus outer membrane usher protein n=1 Tax=Enterobacter mori TaxID=539813 RepID=UPI001B8C35E9|nr:fimbria/pilus outer membrane usher protein [Enterobacter mori]MBS3046392.1 fimbria/pilus outer membrane usher protein [Enterobacter mori]
MKRNLATSAPNDKYCRPKYALTRLSLMVLSVLSAQYAQAADEKQRQAAGAEKVSFDPSFLMTTPGSGVDVARFEKGNPLEAGEYRVDIYLNDRLIGRESVLVRQVNGQPRLCINRRLLAKINFNSGVVDEQQLVALDDPLSCPELTALAPGARASLDTSSLRLDVSAPQTLLQRKARGSVDPALWDAGANALFLGYNTNVYHTTHAGQEDKSAYAGINGGLNIGGWMLRHTGSLNWQDRQGSHYSTIRTYAQRDITPLKARLTLGDANTTGELFDTFAFRGVQLATDEQMWPDSMRGYAPVVRGIAATNAHVTIRQNGAVLYDTTVPPGPFVIDDLYPTGYGGDLQVTVQEADGRINTFSVPYASVAQLLRPGMSRYSIVAGTVRNDSLSYTPKVVQGTWQYGMNNGLTGYTGVLGSDDYAAAQVGVAFGTPLGALALDVTGARTAVEGYNSNGTSLRATYSKLVQATDSNISVAAYRFSSSGYLDLNNALEFSDHVRRYGDTKKLELYKPRSRLSITLSQGLPSGWGQLYLSGYNQNYWGRSGTDTQFQFGYGNNLGRVSYNLSASRIRNGGGEQETQYMLTFSMPLGNGSHGPNLNANLTHGKRGVDSQASVNGMLGADNQFNYNVGVSRDAEGRNAGNVSGVYRSPYSTLQGSYAQGDDYHAGSVGMSGSLVAVSDSVIASPYNANTMAVISAPEAGGARVLGYSGITLNDKGYAVVPYLTPYRMNEVAIDPKGLPAEVELQETSQQVAPRNGAVVRLHYATATGRAVLIRASMPDGEALPFGAQVTDDDGNTLGSVAQGGQIYVRLPENNARLQVKWGNGDARSCLFDVNLPEQPSRAGLAFEQFRSQCERLDSLAGQAILNRHATAAVGSVGEPQG